MADITCFDESRIRLRSSTAKSAPKCDPFVQNQPPRCGLPTHFVTSAFQTTIGFAYFHFQLRFTLFWNGDNGRMFGFQQRFQRLQRSHFPSSRSLSSSRFWNRLVVNHFHSPLQNSKISPSTYLPPSPPTIQMPFVIGFMAWHVIDLFFGLTPLRRTDRILQCFLVIIM